MPHVARDPSGTELFAGNMTVARQVARWFQQYTHSATGEVYTPGCGLRVVPAGSRFLIEFDGARPGGDVGAVAQSPFLSRLYNALDSEGNHLEVLRAAGQWRYAPTTVTAADRELTRWRTERTNYPRPEWSTGGAGGLAANLARGTGWAARGAQGLLRARAAWDRLQTVRDLAELAIALDAMSGEIAAFMARAEEEGIDEGTSAGGRQLLRRRDAGVDGGRPDGVTASAPCPPIGSDSPGVCAAGCGAGDGSAESPGVVCA